MIPTTTQPLDLKQIRADFPVLHQEVNGQMLVYLDNAATTQKPRAVIEALSEYYLAYNANIHRGIHSLAEKATAAFEATRDTVQRFINAESREQVIFTGGTTDGINLVASTYGRQHVGPGDEVIVSGMEHHSNIVPWQLLCEQQGATLKVIPVREDGSLDLDTYAELLSDRTKMVAVVYVSNTLGTVNPVAEIIRRAHERDVPVLLDGAQATSHMKVDVQALDCDFFVFSAHKVYGPTGAGVLYGKRALLEAMPPYQGGGEMIKDVSFERTTYNELPYKFEAGTPNIADIVAMKAALEYVETLGHERIAAHEQELLTYATEKLQTIDGLRVVGTAPDKVSVVSFVVDGVHHQDIGIMLDTRGVAVRTGHHCTQPLMDHFGIAGTARASFAVYNTKEEIDRLTENLRRVVNKLR